jgi:hypothetical protein
LHTNPVLKAETTGIKHQNTAVSKQDTAGIIARQ